MGRCARLVLAVVVAGFARAAALPQSVLDRYDLVGFDPRGIGFSAASLSREPVADGLLGR